MRPGPPPKPTALRILQGNPGKRPLPPHEAKPPIPAKMPPCPPHLNDEARREWKRTGKRLLALGLLTDIDKAELAAYCVSWSRWCEAEDALRRHGPVIMTPNKMLIQSPHLSIANRAMADMRSCLASFGMSPASRSRVVAETPPERDEFGDLFDSSRRGS